MFIFTYFGSYLATLKDLGQYKIKIFPISRNVNKCWRKISRRLVKKQLLQTLSSFKLSSKCHKAYSYIYFIYLGFVKCYMSTYFSVMLQNNYFLEYFIFYIRLLPTEEAVQRYPAKKCLKGFSKINRKQVFSCTFLEHIEKLSYRTPAKKVAFVLPLVKFFKEHQFAVIFSPTFGTTTL